MSSNEDTRVMRKSDLDYLRELCRKRSDETPTVKIKFSAEEIQKLREAEHALHL